MDITMQRIGSALHPISAYSRDMVADLAPNTDIVISAVQAPSPSLFKALMTLVHLWAQHTQGGLKHDQLLRLVLLDAGLFDVHEQKIWRTDADAPQRITLISPRPVRLAKLTHPDLVRLYRTALRMSEADLGISRTDVLSELSGAIS